MPYGKRKSRRFVRKVRRGAKAVATKALRIAKSIRSQIETKSVEETLLPQAMNNTGVIIHQTRIAQGDDNNQRSGNLVQLKSTLGTFAVTRNPASAVDAQQVKVALVLMKGSTAIATPPTWLDVFSAAAPISNRNPDNFNNFRIIKQWNIALSDFKPNHVVRFYARHNIQGKYYGVSAAQYTTNQIFLMYISDQASDQPTITYRSNTYYTDV